MLKIFYSQPFIFILMYLSVSLYSCFTGTEYISESKILKEGYWDFDCILDKQTMEENFDVVISGISGRFPECDDVNTFKKKLYNCDNFISVNDRKWPLGYEYKLGKYSVPNGTGKYTDVESYDYTFFKIHYTNAATLSIINRKVLEPAFEAIVDAGLNPYSLSGENIGVFTSCGLNELESKMSVPHGNYKQLLGLCNTIQANRISYSFNFTGSSYCFPSDMLGSLQALREGYRQVANGSITAAIVGCSSNILDPRVSLNFNELDFLSQDGLCRAFDKNANGYGRSEAAIVLFLQRAKEAKRIYGKILFCDAYYPGSHMSTILGYNEKTVQTSLETLYNEYNFTERLAELGFMEMNAFGVKRADLIESNALAEVICKNREIPLLVGSVKSNVGHSEGTAGLMSLLKAIFALDTGIIPPNMNLTVIDDQITSLKNGKLRIVDKQISLPTNIVGVNVIGISGMVSHTIIEQHDKQDCKKEFDNIPRLLLLCGRTDDGLRKITETIHNMPFNPEFISLVNDVFNSLMPIHAYRGYTILPKSMNANHLIQEKGASDRPIWFVFSGTGSQWNGMGHKLLDLPVFAEAIKNCDTVLKTKGINIYYLLTDENPKLFDSILNSFVTITSVQIGLVEILKSLGINADGIVGHSAGEVGCAYADGCLTLDQAILSSYERGLALMQGNTIKGMMAAVGMGYNKVKDMLPEEIVVACRNSAESCTLSGPAKNVADFVEKLKADGIFAKAVNVANIAAHSKYISSIGPTICSNLKKIIVNPIERSSKWICTSLPPDEWNTPLAKTCSAEYLANNTINYVFFEDGIKNIPENAVVIEIAPHGLLQPILKRALPTTCTNISLTKRSKTKENLFTLLSAIGQLFIAGCDLKINGIFPKVEYPVSRGTPSVAPFCSWHHEEIDAKKEIIKPLPGIPISQELISVKINEDSQYSYLKFHTINDQVVIPPSFFMYLVWWIRSIQKKIQLENSSVVFENVKIHRNVKISIKKAKFVSVMIQTSGKFHVYLENETYRNDFAEIILTGKIEFIQERTETYVTSIRHIDFVISGEEYHKNLEKIGYQLKDCFVSVKALSIKEIDCYAKITWKKNWVIFIDCLMKIQRYAKDTKKCLLFYPSFIRKLTIRGSQFSSIENGATIFCHMDLATNRLECNGLEICGLEYEITSPPISVSKVNLRPLHFIPFKNPSCESIEEFFELGLLLAVQYKSENDGRKLIVFEMSQTFSTYIRSIPKKNEYLKSKLKFCDLLSKKCAIRNKSTLAITTDLCNLLDNDFEFVLIISRSLDVNHRCQDKYTTITKQIFDKNIFCLLKKKSVEFLELDIQRKYSSVSVKTQSEYKIKYKGKYKTIIIHREMEASDLRLMLSEHHNLDTIRLFILDDDEFTIKNESLLMKFPLELDLPFAIFKNGEWGCYVNLTRYTKEIPHHQIFPANVRLDSIDVHFYHTDGREKCFITNTFQSQERSFAIEFSGIDLIGQRTMGLTSLNFENSVSNVDPQFLWQIPDEWSLADAATVPFTYSLSYYILSLMIQKPSKMSVLINIGEELLLAQVCISLFLNENYDVFVTVSSEKDAAWLKNRFPLFNKNRILKKDNCQYEWQLFQQNEKKGVNLVINCLAGLEYLNASFNCVGQHGLYVETVESNCNNNYSIGMYPFKNFITFKAIPNKISSLLNLSMEDKLTIRNKVQDGIRRGLVIPQSTISPIPKMLKNQELHMPFFQNGLSCLPQNHVHELAPSKLQYDSFHSYIIIGGDDSLWIELLEWLKEKGARNFISILDAPPSKNIISGRQYSISFLCTEKISTIEKTQDVIETVNAIAPLEAVYFVSLNCCGDKIRNFDVALQNYNLKVYFINIFSGGLKEMEQIRSRGLPTLTVHCNEVYSGSLSNILTTLDSLPYTNWKSSPTMFQITNLAASSDFNHSSILHQYLPKDMQTWAIIGNSLTKNCRFEERTTLSLPYAETRGVYPIFAIPSIGGFLLDTLFKKLLYPVFCATLSESTSNILDVASKLFQELNKIQPQGPVTLLSETWNTEITIELLSLIRRSNRKYQLFLLDGNPFVWKEYTKKLANTISSMLENNFSKKRPHLSSVASENEYLTNKICDEQTESQKSAIKALNAVRNHLLMISRNEYKNEILENVILFSYRFTRDDSVKLSVSSDIYKYDEDNYISLISNEDVCSKINENAAHSWWN